MNKTVLALTVAAGMLSGVSSSVVLAEEKPGYVEARYHLADSVDTLTVEGEYAINEQLYAIVELASFDFDGGGNAEAYALGVGHTYALSAERSVSAEARYLYLTADGADSESGFAVTGIYAAPISAADGLDFEGELSLIHIDSETDWEVEAGITKAFSAQLSGSATLIGNEDDTLLELGVAYALNDQVELAAEWTLADEENELAIGLNARF